MSVRPILVFGLLPRVWCLWAFQNLTGFEYEWSVLQSRLHCLQYQRSVYWCFWRSIPSAFLRSLLNSGACQSDLEQLLAIVDVHEELLDKGGRNMELLMGKGLL